MNKNNISYFIIVGFLVITSFFSLNLFLRQRSQRDLLDIHTFPYKFGEWQGKDYQVTELEYDMLETRNLIVRDYKRPNGDMLYLFIIYSETNRSVFHPPEVCLMGGGSAITEKNKETIELGNSRISANKALLEKDGHKELLLYCYKAQGLYTDNFLYQQAYFAFHQMFGRRVQGATIRVSMPIKGSEEKTLEILKSFLKDSIRIIGSLK